MEEVFAPVYGAELEDEALAKEEVSETFLDAVETPKDQEGKGPVGG
jgi:hypothetical protein